MRRIDLDILQKGQKGMTPVVGNFLLEGLVYCLTVNGHQSGTILNVSGEFEEKFELVWSIKLTEQIKSSWNDSVELVEYGATGLAALLTKILLDFEFLQRNLQTEGCDYKIGVPENSETRALLEVSGILTKSNSNTINTRVNRKLEQVKKKVKDIPAYIIVTEFSVPKSKIVKYG